MQRPESSQHVEYAGLGSRFIATLVDTVVLFAALVAMFGLAAAFGALQLPDPNVGNPFTADIAIPGWVYVATYGLLFAYYAVFEGIMAATPGKLALGLRVTMDDGRQVTGTAVVVRNIIRIAEAIAWYIPSAISCLISRTNKRLGDYAAGTVVVRRAMAPAAAGPLPFPGVPRAEPAPLRTEGQRPAQPSPAPSAAKPDLSRLLDDLKTAALAALGAHELYQRFSDMELARGQGEEGEDGGGYSPGYVASWYSLSDAVHELGKAHKTMRRETQRKDIGLDVVVARQPDLVYLLDELLPYLEVDDGEQLHDAYLRIVQRRNEGGAR